MELMIMWQKVTSQGRKSIFLLLHFIAIAIVVWLGYLTWQQFDDWHNRKREPRHILALKQRADFRVAFSHFLKGDALFKSGDVDGAIKEYNVAIQIAPAFVEAYNNLGFILARRAKVNEAVMRYQKALEIDPGYVPAHINLGLLFGERGDMKAAIEHLRKAARISPSNPDAHYHLGRFLAATGNVGEAAEQFREALKIDPNFEEASASLKKLEARTKSASRIEP
jgi:tetratricopeptide (TPR) repeat protein